MVDRLKIKCMVELMTVDEKVDKAHLQRPRFFASWPILSGRMNFRFHPPHQHFLLAANPPYHHPQNELALSTQHCSRLFPSLSV